MFKSSLVSLSFLLSAVCTIAPALGWAYQTPAANEKQIVTLDNYHDVIVSIRKDQLSADNVRSVANALVSLYTKTGDTQILRAISELHAKDRSALETAMSHLVQVIQDAPSDRALCNIYDMLVRFDGISPSIEKAVETRFSQAVANDDYSFSRSKEAAILLKFKGSETAREWLEANCGHEQQHVRAASAFAFGLVGKQAVARSSGRLHQLLKDPSVAVRTVAAEAIWKTSGDSETVLPVLVAALKEPAQAVVLRPTAIGEWGMDQRHIAASCLGRIGATSPAVIDGLLPLLHDRDTMLRILAIRALGEVGKENEKVRRSIQEFIGDGDPAVSSEVATVLKLLSE